jgi:hypothetical protein
MRESLNAHENEPTCAQFNGPSKCARTTKQCGGGGSAARFVGREVRTPIFPLMGMTGLLLGRAERSTPGSPEGAPSGAGVDGESAGRAIMSLPTIMGVVARRQTSASLWDYDAEAIGNTPPFRSQCAHAPTCARGDLMLARANDELFASPLTNRSQSL